MCVCVCVCVYFYIYTHSLFRSLSPVFTCICVCVHTHPTHSFTGKIEEPVPMQQRLYEFVESEPFADAISVVIVINVLCLGLQHELDSEVFLIGHFCHTSRSPLTLLHISDGRAVAAKHRDLNILIYCSMCSLTAECVLLLAQACSDTLCIQRCRWVCCGSKITRWASILSSARYWRVQISSFS